jgi:hypothetical protein
LPSDIQTQVDALLKTSVTPGTGDKVTNTDVTTQRRSQMPAADLINGIKNGTLGNN